jgi:hypothetical protein
MPLARLRTRILPAVAFLATAACADSPAAPLARASTAPSLATATTTADAATADRVAVSALKRRAALAQPVTLRFTATSTGGSYDLPGTGLRVIVPANAVPVSPLTITVTALAGSAVAYDFEPHGTVFRAPLMLSVEMGATTYAALPSPGAVEAGYFASTSDIDQRTGGATVSELRGVTANRSTSRITFPVSHFSGYMLSSGRQ